MGLIDLKTDLKSLKYGDGSFGDRRGNGWSGQPYITTDIPEEPEGARTDFLLRQGALIRSGKDTSRLTQFLFDTKNLSGFGFISKQIALSLLNPIVVGKPNRQTPISGLYNPVNTIAQVAGNALGLHIEKQGLLPLFNDTRKYLQLTREYNEESTNKLTILYNSKIQNKSIFPTGASLHGIDDLNSNNLFKYLRGPGGIRTIIPLSNPTIKKTDTASTIPTLESTPNSDIRQTYINGSFGEISFSDALAFYNTTDITRATAKSSSFDSSKIITNPLSQIQPTSPLPPTQQHRIGSSNTPRVLGFSSNYFQDLSFVENFTLIPERSNAQPSLLTNLEPGEVPSVNPIITDPTTQIKKGREFEPFQDNRIDSGSMKRVFGLSSRYSTWLSSYNDKFYIPQRSNTQLSNPDFQPRQNNPIITDPITQIEKGEDFISPPFQDNRIDTNNIDRVLGISKIDGGINDPSIKNALPANMPNRVNANPTVTQTSLKSIQLAQNKPTNQNLTLYVPENKAGKIITDAASTYGRSKAVSYLITTSDSDTNPNLYTSTNQNSKLEGNDIIKFYIEVINNDSLQSEYLYFRAYIDNFSDGFSSTWNETKYVGRAEGFYAYGGFNRSISLGFTIYAHSEKELKPIYTKLNQLAGIVSPDYSGIGFMRGTYVKLTVGDYLKSVPGIIKGFKMEGLLDGGWGIKAGEQLPKHIKISGMDFQPIHDFVPRKDAQYFNV